MLAGRVAEPIGGKASIGVICCSRCVTHHYVWRRPPTFLRTYNTAVQVQVPSMCAERSHLDRAVSESDDSGEEFAHEVSGLGRSLADLHACSLKGFLLRRSGS